METGNFMVRIIKIIIKTVIFCLLGLALGQLTVGFFVSAILHLISGSIYPELNEQIIKVITDNCSFFMIIVFLHIYTRKKEKTGLYTFYVKNQKKKVSMSIFGILIGVVSCTVAVSVALLMGDLKLKFNAFNIFILLLFLGSGIIQSYAEEILFRGYMLEAIRKEHSVMLAIVLNSALFSIIHILNPGITILGICNIVILGVVFSCLAVKFKSLHCVVAMHVMWNFTQEIIFGLPNSGITFLKSVFSIVDSNSSLFYSQKFGIEATLQCLIIWGIFLLILKHKSEKQQED